MIPSRQLLVIVSLALASAGCTRPPDAPETLDDLASYLYEHVMDTEADSLVAGVNNLENWLAQDNPLEDFETNMDSTSEGYAVTNLTSEAVEALDGVPRNLDKLLGASVAFDVELSVEQVVAALIADDMQEVFPGSYQSYERTFSNESDRVCFLAGDCDSLDFEIDIVADYPLNLTVQAESRVQYRRIELADGRKPVLQRLWMLSPAVSNMSWFELEQQYFLAVYLPRDSGIRRVDAMWVKSSLGDTEALQNLALNLAIDGMRATGDRLEAYFEGE